MTALVESATATPHGRPRMQPPRRGGAARRWGGLALAVVALVVLAVLSVALGARMVPLGTVLDAFTDFDGSTDHVVIRQMRVPRTVLGIVVGAALGLAGALTQALTRNPLGDPGILGLNAGAAACVVTGITLLGIATPSGYVWLAIAGAFLAALLVYGVGAGRRATDPIRLALAGTAIAAIFTAYTTVMVLRFPDAFDDYRFWAVGSLVNRGEDVIGTLAPFFVVGIGLGLLLGRPLNALALGDETGQALGSHPGWTRLLTGVTVTVLCGAATAAAGPIGFVGLAVPHFARAVVGVDQRWVLAYSVLLGPVMVLAADIVGRLLGPAEIQAGIVTAFLGAPVLIMVARRRRVSRW